MRRIVQPMRIDEPNRDPFSRSGRQRLRSIFLSDVHLGTRASKAERLLDFLRRHDADAIYLVGDIVDGIRLRSSWYWPPAHGAVVDELVAAARRGTRIVYLPGNHDAFLRHYPGIHFNGIEVLDVAIHVAADGRSYIVTHGDHLDRLMRVPDGVAAFGARLNGLLYAISDGWNEARLACGLPAWSLSRWLRHRVKGSLDYLGGFERRIVRLAALHGASGVICGHVHAAGIHDRDGVSYINCGDWVDSCTAVVERSDGCFEIRSWPLASRDAAAAAPLGEWQEA